MFKIKLFTIVGIIVIGISFHAYANESEDLPTGYSWYENDALQVALPLPDGWHIKVKESSDGTQALFITKEKIDKKSRFQTGYTLNYFKNFTATKGISPTKYAMGYVLMAQASKPESDIILEPWEKELGSNVFGAGIRIRTDSKPTTIVHYFLVADENEDSLRIMFFEAPESEWEESWKLGELMLSRGQLIKYKR